MSQNARAYVDFEGDDGCSVGFLISGGGLPFNEGSGVIEILQGSLVGNWEDCAHWFYGRARAAGLAVSPSDWTTDVRYSYSVSITDSEEPTVRFTDRTTGTAGMTVTLRDAAQLNELRRRCEGEDGSPRV